MYKDGYILINPKAWEKLKAAGIDKNGFAVFLHVAISGAPVDGIGGLKKYQSILSVEDFKKIKVDRPINIYLDQLQEVGAIEYQKIIDRYFIKSISSDLVK